MNEILTQIGTICLVPVVVIDKAADAKPLGEALSAGGLNCIEFTFRTAAAAEAIRTASQLPGMLVGAGTVLNVDTVKRAVDSGAKYIISPGLNPKVVDYCVQNQIPVMPGVATPTEIEMALDAGLDVVKFFPADAMGGAKTLKAIAAPYGMMKFMPTGGITQHNLADYLKLPCVLACGGSWMVAKELIAARNFASVTELAREARGIVQSVRAAATK
jgi:2-dehydro-3-deoxyphosphogluconate aldolase / (4S)-4-hydroxy-2-oxoglutarate aldolase